MRDEARVSGDDIRSGPIRERDDPVLENEFPLLEPLDLQLIAPADLFQRGNGSIEIAMLDLETRELTLYRKLLFIGIRSMHAGSLKAIRRFREQKARISSKMQSAMLKNARKFSENRVFHRFRFVKGNRIAPLRWPMDMSHFPCPSGHEEVIGNVVDGTPRRT